MEENQSKDLKQQNEMVDETSKFSDDNEKWLGVSAYFIFFLPLILNKESSYGKFHANQGLNLFLLSVASSFIGRMIPVVGALVISPMVGLFCFVLAVMGILNAVNGKEKPLPIIGGIRLIQ